MNFNKMTNDEILDYILENNRLFLIRVYGKYEVNQYLVIADNFFTLEYGGNQFKRNRSWLISNATRIYETLNNRII